MQGLLTDRPSLMRKVVEEGAEMSAAERLLVEIALLLRVPQKVTEQ